MQYFTDIKNGILLNYNCEKFPYFCYIDCQCSIEMLQWGGSKDTYNLCFWVEVRDILFTPVNPISPYTVCGFPVCSSQGHVHMMFKDN